MLRKKIPLASTRGAERLKAAREVLGKWPWGRRWPQPMSVPWETVGRVIGVPGH